LSCKYIHMQEKKKFQGDDFSGIWTQVSSDMRLNENVLHYEVQLCLPESKTELVIDIDLGGGFQSGISTTSFRAHTSVSPDYRFALHDETFLDEIGKFFGMQDVVIGYPEFDDLLIIKTDNEEMTRQIFSNQQARITIQSLKNFSLYLDPTEEGTANLHLMINEGITDTHLLQELHAAFVSILNEINHTLSE
jgi:hypothetical protein